MIIFGEFFLPVPCVENREKIGGARSWADAVTEGRSSPISGECVEGEKTGCRETQQTDLVTDLVS